MTRAAAIPSEVSQTLTQLERRVCDALPGKPTIVRLCLVSFMARGHVLLEDVPGVGKTTLAKALGKSLGLSQKRVQFTNDFLPSDLLGVSVYSAQTSEFQIRKGPVFTHVLLADELNRASPRAQSALLEAMSESAVSLDGQTLALPNPFFVIATQNPLESAGVFPLPESQLDRFLMRLRLGYPDAAVETQLLMNDPTALPDPAPVDQASLTQALALAPDILLGQACADYAYAIVARTRTDRDLAAGASPRASIALARASRAHAMFEGRGFVTPDDIRAVALPVLAHRIKAASSKILGGQNQAALLEIMQRILASTPIPV